MMLLYTVKIVRIKANPEHHTMILPFYMIFKTDVFSHVTCPSHSRLTSTMPVLVCLSLFHSLLLLSLIIKNFILWLFCSWLYSFHYADEYGFNFMNSVSALPYSTVVITTQHHFWFWCGLRESELTLMQEAPYLLGHLLGPLIEFI